MKKTPTNELPDAELARLSSGGDEEAFLSLYRRHQGSVFRFAFHTTGSREIAEEVTQEVFTGLIGKAHLYAAERGPFEAYLIGAARNQTRRHLARADRAAADRDLEQDFADCRQSFAEDVDREHDLRTLRAAILRLPMPYREAVVLCDLEGLNYQEAAERMSCAVGTVRSRLHRARAILTAKMRRIHQCPA